MLIAVLIFLGVVIGTALVGFGVLTGIGLGLVWLMKTIINNCK